MKCLTNAIAWTIGFVLSIFAPSIGSAHYFNDIIAFGDSLTDVGNVAGLTIPGNPPVIPGYYLETHFSDNVIWIEILANYLGLPARTPGRGDTTTLTPQPSGNTWAWGGSEAAFGSVQPTGVTEPIPNLFTEVEGYLAYNNPPSDTLYSIWSGADNLLVGGNYQPSAAKKAVKVVEDSIRRLIKAGAQNFLVFNLPKISDTPYALEAGLFAQAAADIYTNYFNKALVRTLKKLRKEYCHKASFYFVNVYKELVLVVDTVNAGGTYTPDFFVPGAPVAISNVTGIGLDYFFETSTYPTNYLFWDPVHPTTQGHQVVAGLVLQVIN